MSNKGSALKRKGGNIVTKKMIAQRMDDVAQLTVALEATLMEWEIWYKMVMQQKDFLTAEQFHAFVKEGPIFSEIPGKIMDSVRANMPKFEGLSREEADQLDAKPKILAGDGLPAQQKKIII